MRYGCCNEPVIVSERSGEFVADLEDDGAMVFGVIVVTLVVDLLLLVGGFLLLVNLAFLLLMFGIMLGHLLGHIWWYPDQLTSLWINNRNETFWNTTVIWRGLLVLHGHPRGSCTS